MNDITLRKFEWADIEYVTQLFTSISGAGGTEKEVDSELVRQTLSHPSVRPETNLTLAHSGADLVGYYQLFPEIQISRAVIAGGVLEQHRGKGIGRQLLSAAMEQVETLNISVLHIQTSADATDARHILESEGFEQVKDYWQMRWTSSDLPELNLRSNFSLKPFRLGEDEAMLTELQNSAFGQHWGFCPNTVEETAARVRIANTDPDGIIFVMDGDRPAGYNWTLMNKNRFGKVGLHLDDGRPPRVQGQWSGHSRRRDRNGVSQAAGRGRNRTGGGFRKHSSPRVVPEARLSTGPPLRLVRA